MTHLISDEGEVMATDISYDSNSKPLKCKVCGQLLGMYEDHHHSETHSNNAPTMATESVDEILDTLVTEYMAFETPDVIEKAKAALDAYYTRECAKLEKAYGGCHNCYGKGYATGADLWSGVDTDQDIGSPGGTVSGGNPNAMKFCTCDRGKQLRERWASYTRECARKVLELLPQERPVRKDPKTISSVFSGQPYPIDQFNSGFNEAVAELRAAIEEVGGGDGK